MKRIAFKMELLPGNAEEYKKRHDEIWPELKKLLKDTGISDYSIFHDPQTNDLFAIHKVENEEVLQDLPHHEVMKKWWAYMKDIMKTNPDNSPVMVPLDDIFYLE